MAFRPDTDDEISEDDDGDGVQDATNAMSTRTFKRFKGAAGNEISSVLVNIATAVSKAPLANTAIDISKVPGGMLTLKRFAQELVI